MSALSISSLTKRYFLTMLISLSIASISIGFLINTEFSSQELFTSVESPIDYSTTSLTSKAPSLIFSRVFEINDDYIGSSYGDDDGAVDAGETIELRLEVENTGDETVTNLFGNITSANPYVNLITYNQSYIQINAGETGITTSYYVLEFDSKLNVSDIITFTIFFTATEGSWSDTFTITIMGVPDPVFYGHIVKNESSGDLNADFDRIIDPGEVINFELYIENRGGAILIDADGYLSTTDAFVTLTDGVGYFGPIDGGGDIDYGDFALTVSGGCSAQYHVPFNLSVVDKFGNYWNSSIELVVAGFPEYELQNITYYEYLGDADNYIDAGETWYAEMTVRNIGDALGANVQVSLDSNESFVDFYQSLDNRDYPFGDLAAGFSDTEITSYYWRFTIADRASAGQMLDFFIAIDDDSGLSTRRINTTIQVSGSADYQLLNFSAYEYCYYESDCYGVIAAGGSYVANITILNSGEADGHEFEVALYTSDEYIDFYYGNGSVYEYGELDVGLSVWIAAYYEWDFTIAEKVKAGHILNFTVVVRDASLREWHFSVSLVVEDGPNTYFSTPLGKLVYIGGPLATIAFCILPTIYSKRKQKRSADGKASKSWLETTKEKSSTKRSQRIELREQKQKEREVLRQQEERERIAHINENEAQLLEKFEDILDMSESVNIVHVAKSLGLSRAQLFEKLIQWQDILPFKIDGGMIEVDDANDFSQSIREKIAEMVKYYSCYHCGFPIERTSEFCPDCKQPIEHCVVCKLPISFGDEVGKCSLCETKGHIVHLQEWVKTQGKCPRCLQKLPTEGIIPLESTEAKKK